jgi:hypothetical protein
MPMMPRLNVLLPCLLLMWWLACPVQAQSTLPLPEENSGSMTCFTPLEMDALEAEIDRVVEDTAREAVKDAVAPLLADLAGCRVARDGWEAVYRKAAADAAWARGALSTAVAGWVGTAIAACVAVLAILIR